MTLVFVIVILFLLPEPLSERHATLYFAGGGVIVAALVGALNFKRGNQQSSDLMLALMFGGGSAAISIGVLHIAIGARIDEAAGLWAAPEPLPAAFTTVGGTLIGFAGILWSLDHQRVVRDLEQSEIERRARIAEIDESIRSVELLLDECKRLSRESMHILCDVLEPFGASFLEARTDMRPNSTAAHTRLVDILSLGTDGEDSEGSELERRPGRATRIPVTAAGLADLFDEVLLERPALVDAFDVALERLAEHLVRRADAWSVEYEHLRSRLAAASQEAPVDLIPFADDLEFLRDLVRLASESREHRGGHARRGAVVIAHFAIVLASLGRRGDTLESSKKGSESGESFAHAMDNLSLYEASAGRRVKHRNLPPEQVAAHLASERQKDARHWRFSRPFIRGEGRSDQTLDFTWHWTDELFPPVREFDPQDPAERIRDIAEDHSAESGPLVAIIRMLTAPDLRRKLIDGAEEQKEGLGGAKPDASPKEPQSPREFWREQVKRFEGDRNNRSVVFSTPVVPRAYVADPRSSASVRMVRLPRLVMAWESLHDLPSDRSVFHPSDEVDWPGDVTGAAIAPAALGGQEGWDG